MTCPKCGGDTGVQFFHDERWNKICDWDGAGVDGEFEKVIYSSTPKCLDCGCRVDRSLLEEYERGCK